MTRPGFLLTACRRSTLATAVSAVHHATERRGYTSAISRDSGRRHRTTLVMGSQRALVTFSNKRLTHVTLRRSCAHSGKQPVRLSRVEAVHSLSIAGKAPGPSEPSIPEQGTTDQEGRMTFRPLAPPKTHLAAFLAAFSVISSELLLLRILSGIRIGSAVPAGGFPAAQTTADRSSGLHRKATGRTDCLSDRWLLPYSTQPARPRGCPLDQSTQESAPPTRSRPA